MNYSKNVSIVVPTMNRPHFVETMVRVLIKTNFGGSLILCDSSDDENFLRISRIRNTIDDRFQCIHHHLPNMNAGNAAAEIIPEIVTPYAIYLPDDDLPIPRTLEACAMFLDNYPDYSAVTGHTVMANVQNGQICNSGYYYIRPYEQEKPSDRLHALLSDYCVICFSLIRTEYLKDMFLSAPTV
ncbi:MAG: TIGR00180 family glycosyltransferase, partial [Ekhidna sp.]